MSQTSTRSSAAERRDARAAAAAPDESGLFTHRQILTILGGLVLGMFLAALDQTVVSTAIRTIADDLHGYDLQAWATTAFLITSTIATPSTASCPTSTAAGLSTCSPSGSSSSARCSAACRPRCTSSPRSARSRASAPVA
jgi:hypothetical protein